MDLDLMSIYCDEIVILLNNMGQKWLKIWMYGLQDFTGVSKVAGECESICEKIRVSFFLYHQFGILAK
jgi:hypothetical protein